MMENARKVAVELAERSYEIHIGASLWSLLAAQIGEIFKPKKLIVVTDSIVGPLYERHLREAVAPHGWPISWHRMPSGEEHKTLATLNSLYNSILDAGCDRRTPILALGGGVVGDTAGFAAATLLRGLPFAQAPTTLLAMVDSSVGGKTGVDMPQGKNLVGAFHQPSLVVISMDALRTLPKRQIQAGMAEVIKYGVIWDEAFFTLLEENAARVQGLNLELLASIVERCCQIKAEVVSKDERESGLREILNFGHTVGHAIEAATGFDTYLHGEAVAVGMVVEVALAEILSLTEPGINTRLAPLLKNCGLPTAPPDCDLELIWNLMHSDKKSRDGNIRMALPARMGEVKTTGGITRKDFEEAWRRVS